MRCVASRAANEGNDVRRLITIALCAGMTSPLTRVALAEDTANTIRDININVTRAVPPGTSPAETGSIDSDGEIETATGYLKLGEGLQLSAPPPAVSTAAQATPEPKSKRAKSTTAATAKPAKSPKRLAAQRSVQSRAKAVAKPVVKKRDTEISSRLINRALDTNTNITDIGTPDPE